MDGFTLGGGMGLAQGADMRVVTERSRLGMPEVAIGYFPDVGGSYFLSRVPGELGTYLGVSGAQIQTAGASRFTLASKKRRGVDFSALKAMTKPLMTKNIWTPTQPDSTHAPISGCGAMPPVARAETPSGKAHTQKP